MKRNTRRHHKIKHRLRGKGGNQHTLEEEQRHFYNVVAGNYKYIYTPWAEEDLQPDLVLTMKLPKDQYIDRNKFLSLSTYMSNPLRELQTAFIHAQKNIMQQMAKKKENSGQKTIKIRLQKAITKCKSTTKTLSFENHQDQKEPFQVECVHMKDRLLDTFTLQYNAIVYTLQKQCGFRVRSFLLYDQQIENRRIFLFLNLSPQNKVRLAAKYKIKKQIDYAQIDFFLNDPCGQDGRPFKMHSSYKDYPQVIQNHKRINRYYTIKDRFLQTNGVMDQHDFTFDQQDRFLLHNQEVKYALKHYKELKNPFLTDYQKQFVYLYNNKRINKGCKILYHKYMQRRQFFQVVKALSQKYKFRSSDQPQIYEKFILPSRYNKGAGYFQRLKGILLYKPHIVGPDGQIDLFLKMEKIKLTYLLLKQTFKLNFLQKIGLDIFAFGSQFQKFGKGSDYIIAGGIDGENLASQWPVYSIFTKLSTVRNYCGDIVGHEIAFKVYMLYFFIATIAPYTLIYILEKIFSQAVYLGSDLSKLAFISIFFRSYISFWTLYQQEYISQYQEQVPSKIFLNTYRGPYTRNLLSDEVNEYQRQKGLLAALKNFMCLIIILTLLVACGAIFHGCRMLLLSIYDKYYKLKFSSISFPHFFSYFLFFILMDLLRYFATDHIIDLLVQIKNPPTDEDARSQGHNFRFFYLLGIEMIAPIFFLIIQPFQNTNCYSKDCNKQIEYYVYSRYLIKLFEVLLRFTRLLVVKYSLDLKNILLQQKEVQETSFQGRLSKLLVDSLEQIDKPQHVPNNSFELINIIGYALYSLLLPIVVIISVGNLLIEIFNVRESLFQRERRPINQSQSILRLSTQLNFIYFVGILVNSWIIFFSFETIENYFPQLLTIFLKIITPDQVFFLKFICTIILSLFLIALGLIGGEITKFLADYWLLKRKKNKFNQYVMNEYTDKVSQLSVKDHIPVKSIFRTWNPPEMPHQMLQKILYKYRGMFKGVFDGQEDAQSARQFIH